VTAPIDRIDQVYGIDVFSRRVMRQRLPKEIYKSLIRTIDAGEQLDAQVANVVAATMKDWAIENGATHFTHWFQPLTGAGRARRLELSLGRPPRHLRGPRLYRLGPDQPRLPGARREQRHPLHSDGLRVVDRRGARHQDSPAPLDGGAQQAGAPHPEALRHRRRRDPRGHHGRPGAGVLPGGPGASRSTSWWTGSCTSSAPTS